MIKRFSFKYWLDCFFKARGHKYIKRVPSGTTKTGRIKYRYIYKVGHTHRGKHVDHHDDMVVNAKFMIHSKSGEEVHVHIKEVKENGELVIVYDDGPNKGKEKTVTKPWLEGALDEEHSVKSTLDTRKKKLEAQLKRMKESGKASAKQIARVQSELDRYKTEKEKKVRFDTPLKEGQEEFTSIVEKMDQLAKMEEKLTPSGMVKNQKQYKKLFEEVRKQVLEFKERYSLQGDSAELFPPFLLSLPYKGNKVASVRSTHKQREQYVDKLKDYLERYDALTNPDSSLKDKFLSPTERAEKVKDLHRAYRDVVDMARKAGESNPTVFATLGTYAGRINARAKNSLLSSREENALFEALHKELQDIAEMYKKPSEEVMELSEIQRLMSKIPEASTASERKKLAKEVSRQTDLNRRKRQENEFKTDAGRKLGDSLIKDFEGSGLGVYYKEENGKLRLFFDGYKDEPIQMHSLNRDVDMFPVFKHDETARKKQSAQKRLINRTLKKRGIEEKALADDSAPFIVPPEKGGGEFHVASKLYTHTAVVSIPSEKQVQTKKAPPKPKKPRSKAKDKQDDPRTARTKEERSYLQKELDKLASSDSPAVKIKSFEIKDGYGSDVIHLNIDPMASGETDREARKRVRAVKKAVDNLAFRNRTEAEYTQDTPDSITVKIKLKRRGRGS